MVVPPSALRHVRQDRVLRLVAIAACPPARDHDRSHGGRDLRARRGVVLRLPDRRGVPRSATRTADPPPARPTGSRAGWPSPGRLDRTAPLNEATRVGAAGPLAHGGDDPRQRREVPPLVLREPVPL